jgi:hypothetical protein
MLGRDDILENSHFSTIIVERCPNFAKPRRSDFSPSSYESSTAVVWRLSANSLSSRVSCVVGMKRTMRAGLAPENAGNGKGRWNGPN